MPLNVRAGPNEVLEMPGLKAGDYVCVRITDNGIGMSPEIVSRAFMPFFTTKDPKTHKGMGLTTAYSIVEQSGDPGTLVVPENADDRTFEAGSQRRPLSGHRRGIRKHG